MSKNLYGSDDSLITGGIIYDETEKTTQDLINAEQKKAGVYYCTCSTAAATQKKTVTISGITSLYDGLKIRVKFTNEQGFNGVPTLDVNSLGAWPINRDSTGMATQHEWTGGEVLDLVYDSTLQHWVIVGGERATEGHYGKTKLFTSVLSPSKTMAATPASVKQVNDKVGDGVLDSGFTATNLTGAANELKNTLNQIETNVGKILPVITGSTNNSGYTINPGDYFEANGVLYQLPTTSAAIPIGGAWSGTTQTNTAIKILHDQIVSADSKFSVSPSTFHFMVSKESDSRIQFLITQSSVIAAGDMRIDFNGNTANFQLYNGSSWTTIKTW